jgi:hypothetical protein
VILCGNSPGVRQVGEWFAKQSMPIPVFIKRAAHRWVYQGQFQVAASITDPAVCAPYIAGSGRDPGTISRVILLQAA